ncbi:MAG: S8 family serine peptidase [Calditrichaeota bacterium]|nr:S8 family serine peptidase [Calditrichota bacterium]
MIPKNMVLLAFLFLVIISSNLQAGNVIEDQPLRSGIAVFSLHPENNNLTLPVDGSIRLGIDQLDEYFNQLDASWVERTFPHCLPPVTNGTDLSTIYTVYFPETISVRDVCLDLAKFDVIDYADPWYIDKICVDHNDTHRGRQYYLDLIEANSAHDFSTGNPTVPVAIIDTGVDVDHADLAGNLWTNPDEEDNGEDDDNNGKIDDIVGWDFYGNGQQGQNHREDNNPNDISGHGTHCSGDAAAVTNNNRGIASIGYECSIMAVRTGTGLTVTYGYQGIEYAAREGAKVISCSWGGYQSAQWAENVIDYAHEHDALVVCAAGNDNVNDDHFPSSYEHAMSVGATDNRDRKVNFSNWGEHIDVSAPGLNIYSTTVGGGYGNSSGTSMSCPIVAGQAVLMRAAYPNLSVDDVWQLIVDGCDDIDDNLGNRAGLMGAGRINAHTSMRLGAIPVLTIQDIHIIDDDNENGKLDPGESAGIAVELLNGEHSTAAEDVFVSLSSPDPTMSFRQASIEFPDIDQGDGFLNDENPFTVEVDSNAIPHSTTIKVTVSAEPGQLIIERTFDVVLGHPDILIVDDDEGDDTEQWFINSVEAMGKGWVHWDVERDFTPDQITLTDYPMVIWSTGTSREPLDELDKFQIQSSLEVGANILLIGKKIGDDPENRSLLRNFFGAHHQQDSVRAMFVNGLSGRRPIANNTVMMLFGGGEAGDGRISPSTMEPVAGADSLVVYYWGEDEVTGLGGVYREDDRFGSKTVYLGFAFESVNDRLTHKSAVLDNLFNWFTTGEVPDPNYSPIESATPFSFSLNPAYPNPFNSSVRLSFTLPGKSAYRMSALDMNGRELTIGSGIGSIGNNNLQWSAGSLPSGTYIVQLDVAGHKPVEQRVVLIK